MNIAPMGFFLHPKSAAVAFLAVVVSVLIVRRVLLPRKQGKKQHHPVGGTIFDQLINFSRLHDYMTDLAAKHKTYRLIAPFRSEVYTSDPANVEYILKTKFDNYGKGWYNYSILNDLLGDGIFTVDGDKWRAQRKVSSHEFSARAIRDVSAVVFKKNAVKLADIVTEAVVSNQPIDIQMHPEKEDVLSRFLQLSEANPKYLRDIILNFVMAGKDTTATTLSWFFYILCKNQLVQEKAAQEIKEATASNQAADMSEFAASVSEEALEKMHYLHAAVTETLRLYPPVPAAGPRICLGKEFAYRQMKIFSAVLLRFFVFKLSDESKAVKYRTMINLHVDGGLSVVAFDRSDDGSE
ncbi:cytochrome [Sesamum angolense]|uniref:Cytochrome n=1 Tax=Sesamum angolense TaxID=2727404 RepID=A0AAE1W0W9_9LAMI|nr:cytochrome [Sesamum angolense]